MAEREGVTFDEDARAQAIWMRAVCIAAFGEPHPLGPAARLGAGVLISFLMHRSGMPFWLICHHRRETPRRVRTELLLADLAREDAGTAEWLERLAGQMPSWSTVEVA